MSDGAARPPLSARTRVAGIIGDPLSHSRSPAMHNAAFAAAGLDWVYVAFPVPGGRGAEAVRGAAALGVAGLNVTMPHKDDAAAACKELTDAAAALGAVNTITFAPDGTARGASTDGPGFLAALADEGVDVEGRDVLVLGSGGTARAIVLALGGAGAGVTVAARRGEAADAAAALAGGRASRLDAVDAGAFDVVVNATPLGMQGERPPLDTDALLPHQFVYDTVYPAETPLLTEARRRGARAAGGIGMLVHQGALAFELWTGQPAPVDVMRRAASGG